MTQFIENTGLGVGLGFRPELSDLLIDGHDLVDFLEVIPEHYLDAGKQKKLELLTLKDNYTIIPHAVDLSLGSAHGLNLSYLEKLARFIETVDPPYWSEHISFSKTSAHDIGHLSPVFRDDEHLELMLKHINQVKSVIDVPLILENITFQLNFTGQQYSETQFLNLLCKESGCGLLLDITNLYINANNHRYDWRQFVDELDKQHIKQLHIIGYEKDGDYLIDSHGAVIQEELWNVYKYVLEASNSPAVIVEWDRNFPDDIELVFEEVTKAKSLWGR